MHVWWYGRIEVRLQGTDMPRSGRAQIDVQPRVGAAVCRVEVWPHVGMAASRYGRVRYGSVRYGRVRYDQVDAQPCAVKVRLRGATQDMLELTCLMIEIISKKLTACY